MGKELLLEIGTEEIPAAFLPLAMRDMTEMIRKEFAALLIRHGEIKAMATPRRLCLSLSDVAEKQAEQVIEKLGPAKRVAFDAQGQPTPAAIGFAKSQGVDVASLETMATEKGEYLACRKKISGKETKDLLPQIIPALITALPFRKSMRWADFELRFARPVHWLLTVYGGEIVPFTWENITSGNLSYGHRFLSPLSFAANSLEEYLARTREHFVVVDPEERRRVILAQAEETAQSLGGKAFYTPALLDEVTYLVEYPTVIHGSFDTAYLALPKEVLITSMIRHQKYFPVTDREGALLPYFLTISNTRPRDPEVVRKGNEKVIRARLSDARFFFEEDRKVPLETRLEDLRGMMFHTLLGTTYEKVGRFRTLAGEIAELVNPTLKDRLFRIATLAKADLSTQMVGEFPELQGVMGREYALLAGEEPEVAAGIFEHYLPTGAGGALPETEAGALASIADKLDSITGFFAVNLIPTGAADPYALRRQALGIINIILAKKYCLPLDILIDKSLLVLSEKLKRPAAEVKADVLAFFKSRYENQLIAQGLPYDAVEAVLTMPATDLVQAQGKIEALAAIKEQADFEPLAIAFKRVGNIIKDFSAGCVVADLFVTEAEKSLHSAYLEAAQKAGIFIKEGDYPSALREIARLRAPVDAFFEAVLVMAEDETIRFNRLSLLEAIANLFREIADFSKIVTRQ